VTGDQYIPDPGDRFTGCLLGMAIGDALGMPAERGSRNEPIADYEPLRGEDGDVISPAGQFSAHTELALCLVESIISTSGFIDPDAAGYRFLQVLRSENAHFLDPTTRAALEQAAESGEFQSGLSAGDAVEPGPAARIAPVALAHGLGRVNTELLVREVLRSTVITHADPEAVNGALAVAWAINLLVRRDVLPIMLISELLAFIDEDDIARRLRTAEALLLSGADPGDRLDGASMADTIARALYLFVRHHDDFERAVLAAANSPDEPAATAAITGALAGAWIGAKGIPVPLVEGLDGRMYILMAAPALYRTAQRRAGLFLQLHQRP
jgi:ADP-ribosyl-[dinitrogen reductase] hydrolase